MTFIAKLIGAAALLAAVALAGGAPVADTKVVGAKIVSCSACRLNSMPAARAFIDDDVRRRTGLTSALSGVGPTAEDSDEASVKCCARRDSTALTPLPRFPPPAWLALL